MYEDESIGVVIGIDGGDPPEELAWGSCRRLERATKGLLQSENADLLNPGEKEAFKRALFFQSRRFWKKANFLRDLRLENPRAVEIGFIGLYRDIMAHLIIIDMSAKIAEKSFNKKRDREIKQFMSQKGKKSWDARKGDHEDIWNRALELAKALRSEQPDLSQNKLAEAIHDRLPPNYQREFVPDTAVLHIRQWERDGVLPRMQRKVTDRTGPKGRRSRSNDSETRAS